MKSKLFYGIVGLAAFFIVFQHLQAIVYDVWEWWDDRNYEYVPTYDTVAAPDAVERPVQKIRPDVGQTEVLPRETKTGEKVDRRYLIVPTHLQHSQGSINSEFTDDIIIVTAQKRGGGLPQGLRLPKSSDRTKDKNGNIAQKILHPIQRSCQGSTYTNLLLHDRVAQKTKPIFDAPLSVVGHQLIETNNQTSHVIAFTAILDTSQDDQLTCKDFIHMAIYDVRTEKLHWVDMGRAEPLTPNYRYNNEAGSNVLRPVSEYEYVMGLGIDENEDGLFDPVGEIIELAILDISEKSFSKIVTASDLAKVQDILYVNSVE